MSPSARYEVPSRRPESSPRRSPHRLRGPLIALALLATSTMHPAAAENAEAPAPEREKPWHMYDGERASVLFLSAVVLESTRYSADSNSEFQVGDLTEFETGEVRGFRIGVVGTFKFRRPVSYVIAGALRSWDRGFDVDTSDDFTFFDFAFATAIPHVGQIKVGKFKEPISLIRRMGMIFEPFMERPVALDAMLPSRNVGIELSNMFADRRMTWAAGWFNDAIDNSKETFSQSAEQYVGRLTGLPWISDDTQNLVHLGIGLRYSDTKPGVVRFRTTPETFFAPDFVDTGDVAADGMTHVALEASWRRGPLWVNSEYVHSWVDSLAGSDLQFRGYHATAAWAITGETRGYNRRRAVFTAVPIERPVTEGGPGAWEVALRYSRVDLNDGAVAGGDMSRISAALNWSPTVASRFSINYGDVRLDRMGVVGHTDVFQIRWSILME